MWKRLWNDPFRLNIIAGLLTFLSFPKWGLWPLIFLAPLFFNRAVEKSNSLKQAFWAGYIGSWIISFGGFYWIVYVLHVLGNISWFFSFVLYLFFCSVSALNFPLFSVASYSLRKRKFFSSEKITNLFFIPALFTVIELVVPKLFPWELGHCLYEQTFLLQAADIFGSIIFTFSIFLLGSCLPWLFYRRKRRWLIIPVTVWLFHFIYSYEVIQAPREIRPIKVSLVQPNIGSLDKLKARRGYLSKTRTLLDILYAQTETAITTKPDIIFWPEAILPFNLDNIENDFAKEVRAQVQKWNIALLTGSFARSKKYLDRDNNAAYLLEPTQGSPELREQVYRKVKLLAFGEYMPLGDTFPQLYDWFPQVSKMDFGTDPGVFTMADGTRLAVSICYEGIFPEFIRQSAQQQIHFLVNLTNDSWFGPTSEPYLHGNQTIFRAIENKVPMVRVTNTGTSFYVDSFGNQSTLSPVYEPYVLNGAIWVPKTPPRTLYNQYGRWLFYLLLSILFIGLGGSSLSKLVRKSQ